MASATVSAGTKLGKPVVGYTDVFTVIGDGSETLEHEHGFQLVNPNEEGGSVTIRQNIFALI
jgi:hypothetical protein